MYEIMDERDSDVQSSMKMASSMAEGAVNGVGEKGDSSFKKPDGVVNGSSKPRDSEKSSSSSSSSSKPKDHHSSSSSKDRDKHHSSSSSSKSSSSEHRHKEGSSSSSSSSKSHHSSSSSSSKPHSSSSGSSSSSSKNESSKPREGSSSSNSKHSSSSSSSSSKHRDESKNGSSSSSHREGSSSSSSKGESRDKERLKEGSSSSSSKPKESSSSQREGSSSSSSKPPKIQESSLFADTITKSIQRPDKDRLSSRPSSSSGGGEGVKSEIKKEEWGATSPVKSSGGEGSEVKVKTELSTPVKQKQPVMSDDEDDIPLFNRIDAEKKVVKKMESDDDDDDTPLFSRAQQMKSQSESKAKVKRKYTEDSGDESDVPLAVRASKVKSSDEARRHSTGAVKKRKHDDDDEDFSAKKMKKSKSSSKVNESPTKGKKKKEDEEETKWKWWEEEKKDDGVKWKTLEHNGPMFAPLYEPLPDDVKFYYDGKRVRLSEDAEEIAGFYAKMLEHDYTTRDIFNKNFFKDWRKSMTKEERELITDLKKCNFKELFEYYKQKSEERKNMSKEEKNEIKKQNEEYVKQYGFCIIDGHKQRVGNFRIEPPGLFRGRGEHPKQGMLKTRTYPEDVIINCSKGAKVPDPPKGHKWKEVRHDNTVTWLACWTDNIQNSTKYVMLNAASKLKGEKDWLKYETARKLHKHINKIRRNYTEDLHSKEMATRQRAVAMYFIDKLALRAGNEKDEDTADTVGCCSLRVEHIKLHEELDGKQFVVEFDFLGKDSIRYYNTVPVDKQVFKSLKQFLKDKNDGDDLFDRLNTGILNKHLQGLMDGLSAKVFRTYNASRTLQEQLDLLTNPDDSVAAKLLSYNRANRAVAILCNHQRAAPKNFEKQMENLQGKIDAKKDAIKLAVKEVKDAKSDYKATKSVAAKNAVDKKEKALARLKEQLVKLEVQATDKDENKEIALSTSKLNYLDPRISVAWCKKWDVPIEKVYNKTQREKFAWAIDMADEDYSFF